MVTSFEAGDHLVLSVPVVRAVENEPWSTVTFALASGQWVTIPQGAKEIVKVLKGPADTLIEGGRRREHVEEASIQPGLDGQATVVFRLGSGQSEFEFSAEELARFAGRAVSAAARLQANAGGPSFEPDRALDVTAISVDGGSGSPAAVQLAVQAGRLKLTFELEPNTLLQAVKDYLDRRKSARAALTNGDGHPAHAPMNGKAFETAGSDN